VTVSGFDTPAVINYQMGTTLEMDVFVLGFYTPPAKDQFPVGGLYLDYWNGANWNWVAPSPAGW